jgi:hypothetical protein
MCAVLGLVVAACGGDELTIPAEEPIDHTVGFVGNVYDGATGERLTDFTIGLIVGDVSSEGTVAEDGRYSVGPIGVWNDFTVVITATGYRAFLSHNAHVGLPSEFDGSDDIADMPTHQTLHFDAYLFPSDIEAPGVTFTIQTPVQGETPEGKIRLRPTSASVLADDGTETPVGVPGQVWTNDEDLQNDTIADVFSGGSYQLSEGDLIYGVTYEVTIWDVVNYQPFEGTYRAGVEADKTFMLEEEVHEPILVVSSTIDTCVITGGTNGTAEAAVTILFNQPIEFAEATYPEGNEEALDDSFSMNTTDCDADLVNNELATDSSPNNQELGTSITIDGATLELSWNASAGLVSKDVQDLITSATYGGLALVQIQRLNGPASATSLSAAIGQGSITCQGPSTCP